jgi:hypothetical protein
MLCVFTFTVDYMVLQWINLSRVIVKYPFFVTLFYTMLHVMVLTGFETVIRFVKKFKARIFLQHAYEFVVVSTLRLIVYVVCLYIQVIILCCNGSISAVSLLNIHELYGFFVTLFYTMLHVMVLTVLRLSLIL